MLVHGGAKAQVGMKVWRMYGSKRADCIVLYHKSSTWQGPTVMSKFSTSLPAISSDSWVLSTLVETVSLCTAALSCAIYAIPIWPQSDMSYRTVITVRSAVIPAQIRWASNVEPIAEPHSFFSIANGSWTPPAASGIISDNYCHSPLGQQKSSIDRLQACPSRWIATVIVVQSCWYL